jgi:glycosyltransferase involved in cell wall biosynthesis
VTRRSTQPQGHDVAAVSASSALYVVVPGDLETRTGGYGYDRRIIAGLRERGWTVELRPLDDSFPAPTAAARARAAAVLAAIPDGSLVLADGLALGALPDEAEGEAARLKIVALVHHPLAAETGIDPALASALEISERRALAASRSVVVTSRATAARLADYGVAADRITVVEPGTDPAPLARGSAVGSQPSALSHEPSAISHQPCDVALLCVATVTPRKGYELLMNALAAIPHRNWRLTCAGSLDRDPATVARVRAQLRATGLDDRVSLAGDMDASALAVLYDRADVFVLPTLHEGYGMAVAEALARGLPVVSTATGAIEDLVLGAFRFQPDRAAGIVVPPGDLPALTDALSRVIGDPALRARLADGASRVRDNLPTWEYAAAGMARALEREDCVTLPGFSAEWLALREPADHAARSADITRAVLDALPRDAQLRVLDLAAGSGSNLRYVTIVLAGPTHGSAASGGADPGACPDEPLRRIRPTWLLVDHDRALLARVPKTPDVVTRCMDLSTLDDPGIFEGRALVTASALLDLVSEPWLRALAGRCAAAGAHVLFALNYDGRILCSPEDPDDALVAARVNEHQRTDKGFGPALGPDATDAAARCFEASGYGVRRARSDWTLTPDFRGLQRQLIDGWAQAAAEMAPEQAIIVDAWRERRLAHIAAGWSEITVGHEDLVGWPSGSNRGDR